MTPEAERADRKKELRKKQMKKWNKENPLKVIKAMKKWRSNKENQLKTVISQKAYQEKNKESIKAKRETPINRAKNLAAQRKWRATKNGKAVILAYRVKNKAQLNKNSALKVEADKAEIFRLEGNKCVCCGIDDPMYFQIDHVNNDGSGRKTEKVRRNRKRVTLKAYLENPKNFQLLCANCNIAKHWNGGKLYKPKKKKG
tara:strand:- start:171 stop:770 length:600 start_codon:yes stop_codon:yes gene_type:complete